MDNERNGPAVTGGEPAQSPQPFVSVVIRSYNEARFIGRLLLGLKSQSYRNFEVIVVDSGSSDGTVAIAKSFGATIVTIPSAEFSFGRSLNLGCRAARGEILVFASAHVYPTRTDWLARLVEPFSKDRVAIVYGKQRGSEASRFSEQQLFRQWFPDEPDLNQLHHFCNNANCAIRKSWWEQAGYDETLTGLEDLAWAKDAMRRGARIVYEADAEIIHVHDESYRRIRNRYFREAIALKHIEPGLKFGLLDFLMLTTVNVASDLGAAFRQGKIWQEARGILLFRINQFWGTYKGHRFHAPVTRQVKNRFYFPAPSDARSERAPARAEQGRARAPLSDDRVIDYSRL